jgi:hypothetical protein
MLPAAVAYLCLNILQDCHWSQREGWSRVCWGKIIKIKKKLNRCQKKKNQYLKKMWNG